MVIKLLLDANIEPLEVLNEFFFAPLILPSHILERLRLLASKDDSRVLVRSIGVSTIKLYVANKSED